MNDRREISNVVTIAGTPGIPYTCVKCGALWHRFDPMPEQGFSDVTWSVKSPTHGDCCERGYMDLIMIPLDSE